MLKNIINSLFGLLLLLAPISISAQIVASDDVILCEQETITLTATANGIDGTDTGIGSDDTYGGVVNIGFNFTFYGNTYNQCVIASNNYITFNIGNANGFSPWGINAAVPNAGNPLNAIMCPWQDINPGIGGNIQYSITGDAPNRVFTVTFCAIPMFQCTDVCYTSQIKLFETTNIIETHISEKPLCATWNGGAAIHALHNNNGTIANVVTGPDGIVRNFPNQWDAVEDAYRFTPNGANDYIIQDIDYLPVITGNTVTWLDEAGNILGTGNSIDVTPTETTTYFAQAELCEGGGCAGFGGGTAQDEVNVIFEQIEISYDTSPASCSWESAPDGQISANPIGTGPFDFTWQNDTGDVVQQTNSQNSDILNNIPPGDYLLTISTDAGCLDEENISVEMDGVMPNDALAGDDQEICSDITSLSANNPEFGIEAGQWTLVSGTGLINNSNDPNTIVTGLSIGDNIFQWSLINDCGSMDDLVTITVLDGNPQITPIVSPIVCDLNVLLSANVEGDILQWTGNGPGDITFSSANSMTTNVDVTQYGTYDFTFLGCAGSQTISVEFVTTPPSIFDQDIIFCDFETTLEAISSGPIDGWSTLSSPVGGIAVFSDSGSANTNVTVTQYGTYQFMFTACESSDLTTVTFAPDEPFILAPDHQDCIFEADLVAYTEAENGGPWNQIFGEPGAIFEDPFSPQTVVTVPEYGIYIFEYSACEISSVVQIGFSCELVLPNVITPNGDDVNDLFIIDGLDPEIYSNSLLTVFNRWGSVVYIGNNYGINGSWWDGEINFDSFVIDYSESEDATIASDGIYYYVLDVFNNTQNQKETYKGYITILKD